MLLVFYQNRSGISADRTHRAVRDAAVAPDSETAMFEVAYHLSSAHAHEIYILGSTATSFDEDGLRYVGWADRSVLIPWDRVDWFVVVLDVADERAVEIAGNSIRPARTKVLAWMHSAVPEAHLHDRLGTVYAQAASDWIRRNVDSYACVRGSWTIPNGVSPAWQRQTVPAKRRGKWVFPASFDRGGDLAIRVFRKVRELRPDAAAEFSAACVNDPFQDPSLFIANGSTREDLDRMMLDAEYFVFPISHPSGIVIHETYAAAILGALAAGVVVITWDVEPLRSQYGGYVRLIATGPPHGFEPFSVLPDLLTDASMEAMAREVLRMDDDAAEASSLRERGMRWAREQLWNRRAQDMNDALSLASTQSPVEPTGSA